MAKKTTKIRGITIELGGDAAPLNDTLKSVNKELNTTQNELKDIERLLKLDPTNVNLLEQKQRKLAKSIENTSDKLESLKEVEKEVQRQMAEGKDCQKQYDALQREIISVENSLSALEKEADNTNFALKKINEKPFDEVADAAEDAEKAIREAGRETSNFADYLKAGLVVEGVKGVASTIKEVAEETAEYRKIMGSLEISSEQAGYTAQQTEQSYKRLYGVLADDQTAATTTANLQALELSQRDLQTVIDGTIGAWATYGDSIPIDGLAESINETVKAKQVTGTLADVLNWGAVEGETFGVMLRENTEANEEWNQSVMDCVTAEDYFNLALQECANEAERANLILQLFRDRGLISLGQAWQKNNEELVKANQAQAEFTQQTARMAEMVSPVLTEIQEGFNGLLTTAIDLAENINFEEISAQIEQFFAKLSEMITFLIQNAPAVVNVLTSIAGGLAALKFSAIIAEIKAAETIVIGLSNAFPLLGAAISALTSPVFWLGTAITALVLLIAEKGDEIQQLLQELDDWLQNIFVTDWRDVFGLALGNILNGFMATMQLLWNSVKQVLDGIIDFIQGAFAGDWERAWNGIKDILNGIWNVCASLVLGGVNVIISAINGMIDSINNAISLINSISFKNPFTGNDIGFDIPELGNIPYLAKGGILNYGSAVVGEAGPELLTLLDNGKAQVTPLTNKTLNTNNYGGVNVNIYGDISSESDARNYGKTLGEEAAREMRARGIT